VLAVDHKLYFWTITCRGREISLEEAEEKYYEWTHRLLTNAYTVCKRKGVYWAYSQTTERQHKTRQHPHSHIICTFLPPDAVATKDSKGRDNFVSEWFTRANFSAGLGAQHKISGVQNTSAVSRYVAKYMFKDSMSEEWPSHWRRMRYSNNWPKISQFSPDFVRILRTPTDWQAVSDERGIFSCASPELYELARHHLGNISRE